MIHYELIFSLDVSPADLKEMLEPLNMPVPMITNVAQEILSMDVKKIPSKEEREAIVKTFADTLKGKKVGRFEVVNVHFKGTGDVYEYEECE